MRISFDIDDLLVCGPHVPAEHASRCRIWPHPRERLRHGTSGLMAALRERGCEIWIYTTSDRSPRYISRWLRSYDIRVDGVVNGPLHRTIVGERGPSKYPPAFAIDLHVDDSEGVAREGNIHGFSVVVIRDDNPGWAAVVVAAVDARIAMAGHAV